MMMYTIIKRVSSQSLAQILFGIVAIAASAQINIPIKPVPISLQSMVLMAICLSYSPKLAQQTVAGYIIAGLLGAPVFVNFNAGIVYALGPTGGYLFGFWLMSVFMPYFMQHRPDNTKNIFLCCLLGQIILYVPGILWLGNIIGYDKAFYSGFLIYIPSGIIKIILLVAMRNYIKRVI